jgi:hypothetical protein
LPTWQELPPNWQRIVTKALPAILLGVLAFVLVMLGTRAPGPGLDPDAVSYLGAAESLAHHGTYRIPYAEWASADSAQPLAHFPPGFSTVLALPIAVGVKPVQSARLIEATAAFTSTVLLVLLVSSATNMITAALLALALFAMTAMHEIHISVLSEPLYIALLLLALTAMVRWPERPLRGGIPAALAVMTRYAGMSIVAAVALWQLARTGTMRERITRAATSLAPAFVLQLWWVLRTERARDAEEIRRFAVYGNLGQTLHQGLATVMAWLVPDPSPNHDIPFRGLIAIALAVVLGTLMQRGHAWLLWSLDNPSPRTSEAEAEGAPMDTALQPPNALHTATRFTLRVIDASALLIGCYLALVLTSRVLADPLIPLDERLLAPALVLAMIILGITISVWWRRMHLVKTRRTIEVMLVMWWLAAAGATYNEAHYALTWGSDFAGKEWRTSELIAWAKEHAAHTPLYTNWPAAVYFYLHRNSHELPRRADEQTLAAFGDSIRARHGIVLLFGPTNGEYVPNDTMFDVPGLEMTKELKDGVILAPVTPH